jgi:hypothetical protein
MFHYYTVTATVLRNEKLRNIELSLQQYNSFEPTSFQKKVKQLMKELHVM